MNKETKKKTTLVNVKHSQTEFLKTLKLSEGVLKILWTKIYEENKWGMMCERVKNFSKQNPKNKPNLMVVKTKCW